ncbi:sigma-70 family RNA polymerase sigma factor [Niabella terrae]
MAQYQNFTEAEVIGRVLDGQKALYEIIVRRFNPYLYKIGRSYNYNHQDTQDLMQETFIDAYKNLRQFEGRANFKTWIIRIMMNNCYRKSEKASFKNEIMQDANESATPMFSNENEGTDKRVQNRELGQIIEKALVKIPFDYRIVFSLREINELSVSETAETLHISESNVKVRLNRAKTMLRRNLATAYAARELFDFNLVYCDPIVENVMKKINELG